MGDINILIFIKEFLSVRGKRIVVQLIIGTIIIMGILSFYDKAYLLTGILTGYFAAAICAWIMIYRTWRASFFNVGKAKGQMWLGLIMRLVLLFIILRTAVMQSVELFFAVVAGFSVGFVLYMINLMIFVYQKNQE